MGKPLALLDQGEVRHGSELSGSVAAGKAKNLSVAMKKKAPQRHGFFRGR
ncbi:MAG: hypothetical protein ABI560_04790 [Myxococcales bacterium]